VRIAFYAPMKPPDDPVPSGDRLMARLLMAALTRGGAEVDLASHFRSYDRGDAERQVRLEDLGAKITQRLVRRFNALPAEFRPDLWFTYHLYHKAPDHLGPLVSRALGIPYVIAEASFAPKQAGGPFASGHASAERAIRAAVRIYSLNPVDAACLRPLVRHRRVLADLAPFVDTGVFRCDVSQRSQARARLNRRFDIPPGVPVILTVAMMRADQKLASYKALAEALGQVADLPWFWLVAGTGPAQAEVRCLAAPFAERVALAGLTEGEGLRDLYAGADLFAWPAVKEAFGMAFLEAASAGLAVVAGRSGGIDAIVEDGATGCIVPAGDAGAMAGALRPLLGDPGILARMGEAGAARALAVNDIEAAARFLSADLRSLIERGPA
jgi:glycosyltransferase involved in cell wall biosynthesis